MVDRAGRKRTFSFAAPKRRKVYFLPRQLDMRKSFSIPNSLVFIAWLYRTAFTTSKRKFQARHRGSSRRAARLQSRTRLGSHTEFFQFVTGPSEAVYDSWGPSSSLLVRSEAVYDCWGPHVERKNRNVPLSCPTGTQISWEHPSQYVPCIELDDLHARQSFICDLQSAHTNHTIRYEMQHDSTSTPPRTEVNSSFARQPQNLLFHILCATYNRV